MPRTQKAGSHMKRSTMLLSSLLILAGGSAATVAGAAAVKPGGTYRGVTDQGKACRSSKTAPCKVTVKVSADGKRIKRFEIFWSADCGGGTVLNDSTVFQGFALPADGRIDISGPYEDSAGNGLTGSHRVKLRGRFYQASNGDFAVRGTFVDVIEVGSAVSTEHYRCRTGRVHWSATT